MTPLLLLLALPATFLATVEATFFRSFPMPLPIMPLVHPLPLLQPFPFMPLAPPPMPIRRPSRPTKTTSEVRSVPMAIPTNDRRGDVIVVINDRDCFSGLCRGGGIGGIGGPAAGFMDRFDLMGRGPSPAMGNPRGNYNIHDADHVVIGGNGRY